MQDSQEARSVGLCCRTEGCSVKKEAKASFSAKRGPKPLHGENMAAFHFRMTHAQRDKLATLGGAAWIRQQIEKALVK